MVVKSKKDGKKSISLKHKAQRRTVRGAHIKNDKNSCRIFQDKDTNTSMSSIHRRRQTHQQTDCTSLIDNKELTVTYLNVPNRRGVENFRQSLGSSQALEREEEQEQEHGHFLPVAALAHS